MVPQVVPCWSKGSTLLCSQNQSIIDCVQSQRVDVMSWAYLGKLPWLRWITWKREQLGNLTANTHSIYELSPVNGIWSVYHLHLLHPEKCVRPEKLPSILFLCPVWNTFLDTPIWVFFCFTNQNQISLLQILKLPLDTKRLSFKFLGLLLSDPTIWH